MNTASTTAVRRCRRPRAEAVVRADDEALGADTGQCTGALDISRLRGASGPRSGRARRLSQSTASAPVRATGPVETPRWRSSDQVADAGEEVVEVAPRRSPSRTAFTSGLGADALPLQARGADRAERGRQEIEDQRGLNGEEQEQRRSADALDDGDEPRGRKLE